MTKNKRMTVKDLIKKLVDIENQNLNVAVSVRDYGAIANKVYIDGDMLIIE